MDFKQARLAITTLTITVASFWVIFWAVFLATTWAKPNNVSKFNLSPERIAKDLDGRNVNLVLNQVWPFDVTQNIGVTVTGKKALDDYVAVVVDVKAIAPVQQEQQSTGLKEATTKDPPKTAKLPSKLQLSGKMKLTYELIEKDWYLLSVENLTLKALPVD